MAAITSFTTYTGKQSEFRELVMKKLAGFARVDQLGFQLVEDVQSNNTNFVIYLKAVQYTILTNMTQYYNSYHMYTLTLSGYNYSAYIDNN